MGFRGGPAYPAWMGLRKAKLIIKHTVLKYYNICDSRIVKHHYMLKKTQSFLHMPGVIYTVKIVGFNYVYIQQTTNIKKIMAVIN